MSFKKWPIDDDGARLSIKSNLTKVHLQEEAFFCEGKDIILLQ